MKNSLQLELQNKIKRANRFLVAKQYSQAIKQYTQGLELYEENRRYNDCVSQQFASLLHSLRGNTHSLNLNAELAEEDFQKSLNINPYSAVTLSRRAKHYMKQKRFSQAVTDIDMALLYDPQNLSYLSLLNSIQNYVNDIKDEQQKKHITTLISQVKARLQAKPPTQSQSDEDDDQELLNFSKLKKIDRVSIKMSPKFQSRKSVIEFKQDQILMYQKDQDQKQEQLSESKISSQAQIDEKFKQQEEQLKQLEHEEQQIRKSEAKISDHHLVLTKTHQKSRKSILRRSSISTNIKEDNMLFISLPGDKNKLSRRSSINPASIKDIDGKLVTHQKQNIKFRPSLSNLSKFDLLKIDQIPVSQKQNLTRTTPKLEKRKSCLRSSNRWTADDLDELSKTAPIKRKTSNFLNIKSIDGQYHRKSNNQDQQQFVQTPVKIQTESAESDDDENQHNIFGSKKKEVLELVENMQQMPEAITKKLSKKKSILKKDSFLEGSMLSWKTSQKKSVLFRTE